MTDFDTLTLAGMLVAIVMAAGFAGLAYLADLLSDAE